MNEGSRRVAIALSEADLSRREPWWVKSGVLISVRSTRKTAVELLLDLEPHLASIDLRILPLNEPKLKKLDTSEVRNISSKQSAMESSETCLLIPQRLSSVLGMVGMISSKLLI